ncbi:MAG: twin-arginine translocation signal domain-containing protein [Caldilineaceae bacterium]
MQHKPMSRRQFLALSGTASAAMMLLAACPAPSPAPQAGGEAAGAAPSAEGTTVTLVAFGESDKNAFAAVADAYMENADVTVETNFLPNDESYYATLQTQYAGGSNPHIASMQCWAYQLCRQ